MKNHIFNTGFLLLCFCLIPLKINAQSNSSTSKFPLLPIQFNTSSRQDLLSGLKVLLKDNNLNSEQIEHILKVANRFQDRIKTQIHSAQRKFSEGYPVIIKNGPKHAQLLSHLNIEIPSLIQRKSNHPTNIIHASYFKPSAKYQCEVKFPTSIILHHILNEVDKIDMLGKILAGQEVIGNGSASLVPHMPFYGNRTAPGESFLTGKSQDFEENLVQLTLDIYLLRSWLASQNDVDQTRVSLSGFSFGAVLGWTSFSMLNELFPSGYGSLVGGGDLAGMMLNRIQNRKNSEVEIALNNNPIGPDELQIQLAPYDPYLWVHRIKNSKILAVVATKDDIVLQSKSVDPLLNLLRNQGNRVTTRYNEDTHTPSASLFSSLKNIILPLSRFIKDAAPIRSQTTCSQMQEGGA